MDEEKAFTLIPEMAMRVCLTLLTVQLRTLEVLVDRHIASADDVEAVFNHLEVGFQPTPDLSGLQVQQLEALRSQFVDGFGPLFAALRRKAAENR